jgi:hypothetical protein
MSGEAMYTGPSTGIETFEPGRQDIVQRGLTPKVESLHVSVKSNPALRERLSPCDIASPFFF